MTYSEKENFLGEFSIRTQRILRLSDINSPDDLSKLTSLEILKFKNLGKQSLKEIREVLEIYGKCLKDDFLVDSAEKRKFILGIPETFKEIEIQLREMSRKINNLEHDLYHIRVSLQREEK